MCCSLVSNPNGPKMMIARNVLEVITLSGHQCIEFGIQERSHPGYTGRGGKARGSSWNTKRLSKDKLPEHL